MFGRIAPFVLTLALTGGLIACGDDSGKAPEDFAADVCADMQPIEEDLENAGEELGTAIEGAGNDPEQAADAFASFIDRMIESFEGARDAFTENGTPDVEGGEEIIDDMGNAIDEAITAMEDVKDQAAEIDTSDPQTFNQEFQALGQEFEENADLENRFQDIEDRVEESGLKDAFDETTECEDLELFG